MRAQRSGSRAAERLGDEIHLAVHSLLLDPERPARWSLQALARELACGQAAALAVAGLHAAGLVDRCEGFVFATPAAARFRELLRE
ncbi:MAG TPA: hypothetical protein VK790_10170 [Solirubrobacteraceae bacterium]|jgi:hypothetical protein|nr:hypothetical protein [Solirubrobacteraceae bacterium]